MVDTVTENLVIDFLVPRQRLIYLNLSIPNFNIALHLPYYMELAGRQNMVET